MQAVVRACEQGELFARPVIVVSNNKDSFALQFAKEHGIETCHLSYATHKDPDALDAAILAKLQDHKVDLVLLVGYMKLVGQLVVNAYRKRILNIHPALLPKYGGKGMYGIRVHEAVINAGEKETGITIHHANERYDEGNIIAQCTVPVLENDTAQILAARVLQQEHILLVETLKNIASGKISLD